MTNMKKCYLLAKHSHSCNIWKPKRKTCFVHDGKNIRPSTPALPSSFEAHQALHIRELFRSKIPKDAEAEAPHEQVREARLQQLWAAVIPQTVYLLS